MKNKILILATSIMMLMPLTIHAQGHIKHAFNVLITDTSTKVESTQKFNKDPETGTKIGQLDVYEFTIPASHHNLVEDIEQAFNQDKEKAYSLGSTSTANKKLYNYKSLAVGGEDNGYPLGEIKNSRYIYALFLDPNDKSKTHRYAYAMEWCEGAKEIVGKLIITYATTQEYRRSKGQTRTISVNGKEINLDGNSFSYHKRSPESWLSEFNNYKNLFLKDPTGSAASYYATQIYGLCKNVDNMDEVEKKLVKSEILRLKMETTDNFIQQLFNLSIKKLDK